MILDFDNEFTEGILAIVATVRGNHVLDAGAARGRDWGGGKYYGGYFKTIAAFNNLTSLRVDIVASDNNDGTGNPVVLSTSGEILLAALIANQLFALPPLKAGTPRRFLGALFTVTGAAPTTGSVKAGLDEPSGRQQDNVVVL